MCDPRHNIIKHTGEEDEEDLEFLRLAALKSLQNKKEPTTSSLLYNNERISNNFKPQNKSTIGQNSLYTTRIEQQYIPPQHQISPNYNTHNEIYFAVNNSQRPPYRNPIDGNTSIRTVNQNNLENYTVDKLNINEPYVPHCLPTVGGHSTIHSAGTTNWLTESTTIGNSNHIRHGYHPSMSYVNPLPSKAIHDVSTNRSNVQLSPRSLAFVEQNNDILARRKGGNLSPNSYRSPRRSKSPDYRRIIESSIYKPHSPNYSPTNSPPYRPSSPDFYKSSSPRRWSLSPHNYKKAISRSPQSQSNQLTRQRSPGFNRKRTISRSPQRYASRSPPFSGQAKQRTRSRSPIININPSTKHRSPPILTASVRRYSRSPLPINERHGRKISKSPKGNNSRHCSPYTSRYPINKNRSPTIHHNKKRSPNGGGGHSDSINDARQNRTRSPIQSTRSPIQSSNNSHLQHQNKNYNKRKSSSPFNQQQQTQRNRSRTPQLSSPLRKYPRRSKDRNVGGHITDQDKNRNKRSPMNKKRRGGDTNGASRNRGNVRHNMRRSQSPSVGLSNFNNYNNRKRRSRSRNIEKSKRFDGKDNYDRKRFDRNGTEYKKRENNILKYDKDIDEKQYRNINNIDNNANDKIEKTDKKLMKKDSNENLNLEITETNLFGSNDITSLTPPLRNIDENLNIPEKINQYKNIKEKSNNDYEVFNENIDNKTTNLSENNDEDDDDDEDGIDLFPSDDSESETEGRFKSSSNRNERKTNVPTLSFAKLNSSSIPEVIKDLQDVCNNKNSKGSDNRFDRRRDDRSKKNDNSRHSRNDKRRYNSDIRNRKNSRSRSADRKNRDDITGKYDKRDIDSDDKRKNVDKSMFKSTFQAIDNEGNKINSKNPKSEKGSSLGKFNNNENNKKRFKDSEDSLENYNNQQQQQLKSHSLKRSLKTSTPPIINFDKHKSTKDDSTKNKNIKVRSLTPIPMMTSNKDGTDTNGKKSIHSRLGAMTNTFKSAKKSWTKTSSSLTPPLTSSFIDKV